MKKQDWGTPPAKTQTVATRISNRSPEWKLHSNMGLAHSAFSARYGNWQGEIWQLIDGNWKLVFSLPMGTHTRAEFDWVDTDKEELQAAKRRLDSLLYWRGSALEDIERAREEIDDLMSKISARN